VKEVNVWRYYVCMYVSGKMRPIGTIPEMGGTGDRGE
jgi:hypothetical protein